MFTRPFVPYTIILAFLVMLVSAWVLMGCDSNSEALAQFRGSGTALINVQWPGVSHETRTIPSTAYRITITVSGPGIETPLIGVIERPQTSLQLDVPAGEDRLFEAEVTDEDDKVLLGGKTRSNILADTVNTVDLHLVGLSSPEDDRWETSKEYLFGGGDQIDIYDALEGPTADLRDNMVFPVEANREYRVTIRVIDGVSTYEPVSVQISQPDGSSYYDGSLLFSQDTSGWSEYQTTFDAAQNGNARIVVYLGENSTVSAYYHVTIEREQETAQTVVRIH